MSKYKNHSRKKELSAELEGIGSLMTFQEHNSASRQVMSTNQVGQALVTSSNNKRRIIRGTEFEFGRFTFKQAMPETGTIVQVIPKFPRNNIFQQNIGENPRTIVVFEVYDDHGDRVIDVMDLSVFHKTHPAYGFRYRFNEDVLSSIDDGQMIAKDTVIADSPNVDPVDGNYMYGMDINIAMMSHPSGIEDGMLISDELQRKMVVNAYGEKTISAGKRSYLLNMYGDDTTYKPFPSIGEYIRDDRLLFATRDYNEPMSIVDMMPTRKGRKAATQRLDCLFDDPIYVEKPGRVIDITVYKNYARKSNLPTQTSEWLDMWHQLNYNFYNTIIQCHNKLQHRFPNGFKISPAFEVLLMEAMAFTVPGNRRDQLVRTMNGQPLDEYTVQITYEYTYNPIIGGKFTGGAGDKGTVVRIVPVEHMPRDADGNVAHMVVDDFSTIKRNNLGRTYEQEIGASCLAVEKRLKAIVETEGFQKGWQYLKGFYEIAAPEMLNLMIKSGIADNPASHIEFVLSDKIYLWIPSHQEKENWRIIDELREHYPPCKGPVTYTDLDGKVVTTKSPVLIGSMYWMLLEKTASNITNATASTRYQHHGILATIQGTDRNRLPAKNNATRAGGESEVRLWQSVMDQDAVAEMLEQTNDPNSHDAIVECIHNSLDPSNIDRVIDRSKVPRGQSRPLQLINHKFQGFGIKLTRKEDE